MHNRHFSSEELRAIQSYLELQGMMDAVEEAYNAAPHNPDRVAALKEAHELCEGVEPPERFKEYLMYGERHLSGRMPY